MRWEAFSGTWAKKFRWFGRKSCVILGLEEAGVERQEAIHWEGWGQGKERHGRLTYQVPYLPLHVGAGARWTMVYLGLWAKDHSVHLDLCGFWGAGQWVSLDLRKQVSGHQDHATGVDLGWRCSCSQIHLLLFFRLFHWRVTYYMPVQVLRAQVSDSSQRECSCVATMQGRNRT